MEQLEEFKMICNAVEEPKRGPVHNKVIISRMRLSPIQVSCDINGATRGSHEKNLVLCLLLRIKQGNQSKYDATLKKNKIKLSK